MTTTSRRIALAAALAAVAISVPVAQGARPAAAPDAFERAVRIHTDSLAVPDAFDRAVRIHTDNVNSAPDALERAVLRAQPAQATRPDDRAGVRGPGLVTSSPALSSSAFSPSSGQGFSWNDAALGTGATLVLCCIVAAAGLARTRQHRKVALR